MSASSFSSTKKKFGLIAPKKKVARQQLSIFAAEDDDEEETNEASAGKRGDIARANKQLSMRATTDASVLEVQGEDNIYDYDGAYDDFKQQEVRKKSSFLSGGRQDIDKKSKYIGHLQAMAKVRGIESDRRYERKLLKERKEEDEQFGDKQKFVTSAYRKKLEEEEKWAYEDKLAAKIEENTGASKQGMHGFYSNLFTKNIAFGSDVQSSATSAYTVGSERQNKNLRDDTNESDHSEQVKDSRHKNVDQENASENDKQDNMEKVGVHDMIDENRSEGEDQVLSTTAKKRPHDEISDSEDKNKSAVSSLPSEPVRSKDSVIQSAKERYLARKSAKK